MEGRRSNNGERRRRRRRRREERARKVGEERVPGCGVRGAGRGEYINMDE